MALMAIQQHIIVARDREFKTLEGITTITQESMEKLDAYPRVQGTYGAKSSSHICTRQSRQKGIQTSLHEQTSWTK
jgi:hypothetical protein